MVYTLGEWWSRRKEGEREIGGEGERGKDDLPLAYKCSIYNT